MNANANDVNGERSEALARAHAALFAGIGRACADTSRPRYHFCAPAHWMNDPNGTYYHNGWYHLFYQCNPYGDTWAMMHWGHARSRDMVHWEHLPIALWPSNNSGEDHCYSGCVVGRESGRPVILYTSVGKRDPEQWLAEAQDDELLAWRKHPAAVLSETLHGRKVDEWRDPFVFEFRGRSYLVIGGKHHEGPGTVCLYESRNEALTEWSFKGTIFDRGVNPLECPNVLVFGERVALICSPYAPPRYWVGTFEPEVPRFIPGVEGTVDHGSAYATNTLITPDGRQVLFVWVRGFAEQRGWNGCIGVPREVALSGDGFLLQQPIREFATLRGARTIRADCKMRNGSKILMTCGTGYDIEATLRGIDATRYGLTLCCDAEGRKGVEICCDATGITVGDVKVDLELHANSEVSLRVLLDQSVLEVFINGGRHVVTRVIYPPEDQLNVAFFATDGAANLTGFSCWPMNPSPSASRM